jgi:hypothetical protein
MYAGNVDNLMSKSLSLKGLTRTDGLQKYHPELKLNYKVPV